MPVSIPMPRRHRAGALAAVLVLLFGAVGCTPRPDVGEEAARNFVTALAAHDGAEAGERTDAPARAAAGIDAAWNGLQAETAEAEILGVAGTGDAATARYRYTWHLPRDRTWTYEGSLRLGRSGGTWKVRWTETALHPELGANQSLVLRSAPAPRANVVDGAGNEILRPGRVARVLWTVADDPAPGRTAGELRRLLGDRLGDRSARDVLDAARAAGGSYSVALLDEQSNRDLGRTLGALPGVRLNEEPALVAPDPGFAPDLMPRIRTEVAGEVDGVAGWRVVATSDAGADISVLTENAPRPRAAIQVSLDRAVQDGAQRAVDTRTDKAMMVVVQPSSGRILAVAQNRTADEDGPVALTGMYPPGSTFKIITAAAALDSGRVSPDTVLPCPGTMVIGSRVVPNYNGFSLGDAPLHRTFARSCNTTFAHLAGEMPPQRLHDVAASFGIGADYRIGGLETVTGQVPPADDLHTRIENGFGQGRVLVSPFAMALVAATAATGRPPVPWLVGGRTTAVTGVREPLPASVFDGLRPMLREVVTSGTGAAIAGRGEIYAKTGEAEVDGGSHAWFVGYRGDLAFATLIVKGGGSEHAVGVTDRFFAALPQGY